MNIEPKDTQNPKEASQESKADRRELIQKLGRFAVYAAPFTVMATTAKAASASGPQGAARR